MSGAWQRADFGPDYIIPVRNCFVAKTKTPLQAYLEISAWVREQGVTIGDNRIEFFSLTLLELWKNIPEGCSQVALKREDFCCVGYCYYP